MRRLTRPALRDNLWRYLFTGPLHGASSRGLFTGPLHGASSRGLFTGPLHGASSRGLFTGPLHGASSRGLFTGPLHGASSRGLFTGPLHGASSRGLFTGPLHGASSRGLFEARSGGEALGRSVATEFSARRCEPKTSEEAPLLRALSESMGNGGALVVTFPRRSSEMNPSRGTTMNLAPPRFPPPVTNTSTL